MKQGGKSAEIKECLKKKLGIGEGELKDNKMRRIIFLGKSTII